MIDNDLMMCQDKKCPRAMQCYRFRALPSRMQSYFVKSPRKKNKCKYFMNAGDRLVRIFSYAGLNGLVFIKDMDNHYLHNALCYWSGVVMGEHIPSPSFAWSLLESFKLEIAERKQDKKWYCICPACEFIGRE